MAGLTHIALFGEIEDDFFERAHRMVWCAVATVDGSGRPSTRVLHPIWERTAEGVPVGWIGTWKSSPKGKHLAANPHVSLAYVADVAGPLYVECKAEWANEREQKQHVWDLFANSEPPLGFDPAPIFKSVDYEDFGVLKLKPWRVQFGDMGGYRRWVAGQ